MQLKVNKSILANNGMNLISQPKSYLETKNKDPYTGAKYDFTDFDEDSPAIKSYAQIHSANLPTASASPPTINSYETRDIINKLTNNHSKVLQLFKARRGKLISLQQLWTSGDSLRTLKYLQQCNDTSLIKDFLEYTFAKNEGLEFVTMEAAAVTLKLVKMLMQKPHTEFQECAKKSYQHMFAHLKPVSFQ